MSQMTFRPDAMREELLDETLGIRRSLNQDFHDAQSKHALEGHAWSYLLDAVGCFLVGLFDDGRALSAKARDWLQAAIDDQEIPNHYFHGGTESSRYDQLAQCNWLLDARHDRDNLSEAVRWSDVYLNEGDDWSNSAIQLTLPLYLEAEAYRRVIEIFEQSRIKPPKSIYHIRGEGTMSYVVACSRLTQDPPAADVERALHVFLKRQVPYWLGYGHYATAARWMKIAFWQPGGEAIATVQRCYDYLPGLERPCASSAK